MPPRPLPGSLAAASAPRHAPSAEAVRRLNLEAAEAQRTAAAADASAAQSAAAALDAEAARARAVAAADAARAVALRELVQGGGDDGDDESGEDPVVAARRAAEALVRKAAEELAARAKRRKRKVGAKAAKLELEAADKPRSLAVPDVPVPYMIGAGNDPSGARGAVRLRPDLVQVVETVEPTTAEESVGWKSKDKVIEATAAKTDKDSRKIGGATVAGAQRVVVKVPTAKEAYPRELGLDEKHKKKYTIETAGAGWFGMKSTPLTREVENDLLVLSARAALDPKRFYKRAEKKSSSASGNVFQIGTVVAGPADFYSAGARRPTRPERAAAATATGGAGGVAGEILGDARIRAYVQRKAREAHAEEDTRRRKGRKGQSSSAATGRGKRKASARGGRR